MCGITRHPHPPPSSIGFEIAIPIEIKMIEIADMRITARRMNILFLFLKGSESSVDMIFG
ncbi:MAG: hypothetical protein ACTSPN_16130 [Promethearchaeota archaeon]